MAADPTCMSHLQNSIETIDTLLSNAVSRKLIKSLFGMGDLEHDDDFAGVLEVLLRQYPPHAVALTFMPSRR